MCRGFITHLVTRDYTRMCAVCDPLCPSYVFIVYKVPVDFSRDPPKLYSVHRHTVHPRPLVHSVSYGTISTAIFRNGICFSILITVLLTDHNNIQKLLNLSLQSETLTVSTVYLILYMSRNKIATGAIVSLPTFIINVFYHYTHEEYLIFH